MWGGKSIFYYKAQLTKKDQFEGYVYEDSEEEKWFKSKLRL